MACALENDHYNISSQMWLNQKRHVASPVNQQTISNRLLADDASLSPGVLIAQSHAAVEELRDYHPVLN